MVDIDDDMFMMNAWVVKGRLARWSCHLLHSHLSFPSMNGRNPFGQIDVPFRAFPHPRMLEQVPRVGSFVGRSNEAERREGVRLPIQLERIVSE